MPCSAPSKPAPGCLPLEHLQVRIPDFHRGAYGPGIRLLPPIFPGLDSRGPMLLPLAGLIIACFLLNLLQTFRYLSTILEAASEGKNWFMQSSRHLIKFTGQLCQDQNDTSVPPPIAGLEARSTRRLAFRTIVCLLDKPLGVTSHLEPPDRLTLERIQGLFSHLRTLDTQ